MPKYRVTIKSVDVFAYYIEADDKQSAREKAIEEISSGDLGREDIEGWHENPEAEEVDNFEEL